MLKRDVSKILSLRKNGVSREMVARTLINAALKGTHINLETQKNLNRAMEGIDKLIKEESHA